MKNIFIQITKQLMGLKVWYNISLKNPTLNYWLYVPKYSWQISAKELIKIIYHKNKQWYVEHKSMSMSFYEDKFHNLPLNHNQYKKLWGKNLFPNPVPFSNITLPLCTIYMQLLFLVEWHDIVGCLMCYMFFWWRLLWLFLLLNQIFVPEAYYLQCKITLKYTMKMSFVYYWIMNFILNWFLHTIPDSFWFPTFMHGWLLPINNFWHNCIIIQSIKNISEYYAQFLLLWSFC